MSDAPQSARAREVVLGLVVAVGLATGGVSKARDLWTAFRESPRSSISESVRSGAAALRLRIGPDSVAVHVSADTDWSGCGVWQRVLHPSPVGCCRVGDPTSVSVYRDLRQRRVARFVFGVGVPPPGLELPSRIEKLGGGLWLAEFEDRP